MGRCGRGMGGAVHVAIIPLPGLAGIFEGIWSCVEQMAHSASEPMAKATRVSQRSLHNAPIFRLLLKVAVNGTHQCDFPNFCGQQCPTDNDVDVWVDCVCVCVCMYVCMYVCMCVCVCVLESM